MGVLHLRKTNLYLQDVISRESVLAFERVAKASLQISSVFQDLQSLGFPQHTRIDGTIILLERKRTGIIPFLAFNIQTDVAGSIWNLQPEEFLDLNYLTICLYSLISFLSNFVFHCQCKFDLGECLFQKIDYAQKIR